MLSIKSTYNIKFTRLITKKMIPQITSLNLFQKIHKNIYYYFKLNYMIIIRVMDEKK